MLRSGILKKLIASYTVVLLLPVIFISFLIYTQFVNNLTDEVINATSRMLVKARDSMDINMRNLNSISARISVNQSIAPLISYQTREKLSLYPDITNIMRELNNYKVTNGIIDNILLYLKKQDTVISNNSKYSAADYFSAVYAWKGIEGEQFCNMLEQVKKADILSSRAVAASGETYNTIAGLYPLPADSSDPSTVLLITIRESVIQQLVNKALGEFSGHIYIIDATDNIVMETAINNSKKQAHGDERAVRIFLDNIVDQDVSIYNENRDESIFCYVKSGMNGWKYVAVMPAGQILSKVNHLKRYYILVVLTVLIIGLILVYVFSKGNYKNVKRITDIILSQNNSSAGNTFRNEWSFINKSIQSYIKENDTLQRKMADQLPVIKNNFLTRLLKGDAPDMDTINEMAGLLNIKIHFTSFAVMLLNFGEGGHLLEPDIQDIHSVIKLAVSSAAEEVCREWGAGYTVEIEKDKIALISIMENYKGDSEKKILVRIADGIFSFLTGRFALDMTVAVSSPHNRITDMAAAYAEAETALGYKMVRGENTVIFFDELGTQKNNRYYYSFEQEKMIVSKLRCGDYEAIKDILDNVVGSIKGEPVSLETVKCTYFEIINTAIKALKELEVPESLIDKDLLKIMDNRTLDKTYNEVCRLYCTMCEYVRNARHYKNQELCNNILEYIQSNFHDSNLSVEMVADAFSISHSYLSRIFKDQSGCNFIDYVHSIRLDKAKELLASGETAIAGIAGRTGYNSVYNFSRVFKRYEGITPTEYRESICRYSPNS